MSTSPLSEDEVKNLLFRNAPPEYENIIKNSTDLKFLQLQENYGEWVQRVAADLPRRFRELGYELPWPDEINNDERALEILHLHRNELYPEGIQLLNQIAPYHNKPEFVFSQAPENGSVYSTEQLQFWYDSIFVPFESFIEEYIVLLEEWRGMVFDVANAQANADKAAMELEMAHHNMQMNAASLQEQRRHNLAMESAQTPADAGGSAHLAAVAAEAFAAAQAKAERRKNLPPPIIENSLEGTFLNTRPGFFKRLRWSGKYLCSNNQCKYVFSLPEHPGTESRVRCPDCQHYAFETK